jgi:hypothetical protein
VQLTNVSEESTKSKEVTSITFTVSAKKTGINELCVKSVLPYQKAKQLSRPFSHFFYQLNFITRSFLRVIHNSQKTDIHEYSRSFFCLLFFTLNVNVLSHPLMLV